MIFIASLLFYAIGIFYAVAVLRRYNEHRSGSDLIPPPAIFLSWIIIVVQILDWIEPAWDALKRYINYTNNDPF